MHDVRLKGSQIAADKPLVIIEDDFYGNVMMGLVPSQQNLLWNAAFYSFDPDSESLPGWSIEGSNFVVSVIPTSSQPSLYANHNILQFFLSWK